MENDFDLQTSGVMFELPWYIDSVCLRNPYSSYSLIYRLYLKKKDKKKKRKFHVIM